MADIGIIGGTGLTQLDMLEIVRREVVYTPYGEPSGPVTHGSLGGKDITFLARHGYGHTIPPHKVNYRANIWALRSIGVNRIVAVAAVGGIRSDMKPGSLAFPDQIIDYTWSRQHTFFEEDLEQVTHIDFSYPYSPELRAKLIQAAEQAGIEAATSGTYGAVQGPRLETAAEIDRMDKDGCHMVGMTGMPESALARELGLSYACTAVIANKAAGRGEKSIHEDISENLENGMNQVKILLASLVKLL